MPIPPIPTKWIRLVRPSIASASGELEDLIRDRARGVGPRQSACRAPHLRPPWFVRGKRDDAIRKAGAAQRALLEDFRGACPGEDFRVLALVVVRRGRQRNQQR